MIPLFDSVQTTTPESGLPARIPRNTADSSSEGGVDTTFSTILDSHGTALTTNTGEVEDQAAGQTSDMAGGNVLLADGSTLPPTPNPQLAPAESLFDPRQAVESNPSLADIVATTVATVATADIPADGQLPLSTQDPVTLDTGILAAGEAVSATVAAATQDATARAGEQLDRLAANGDTVIASPALAVDESDEAVELILPAVKKDATKQIVTAADDSDRASQLILPGVRDATAQAFPAGDDTEKAAQVIQPAIQEATASVLPVTSELGDQAKKLVDRNGLSNGSASTPNNTAENVPKYQPNVVSTTESLAIKPDQAMGLEPRSGEALNALAITASLAKSDGRAERAETQIGPSTSTQDFNQNRVLTSAQPTLLMEGSHRTTGQNFATVPSFATSVGEMGWRHEFVGRMNLMVKNGVQEMKLQLKPAEMGLLEIKLSTEGDKAKVIFNVHNAAARDAIDSAMPRLRDMLEQSGMQLAHSEVNDQSSQQNQGNASDNLAALTARPGVDNEFTEGSPRDIAVRVADSQIDYYI